MSETPRLTQLLAEILRLPPRAINDELTLAGTDNWDSLTHMELIAALEQEFSIELSVDEIVAMVTFPGIQSVLGAKGVDL